MSDPRPFSLETAPGVEIHGLVNLPEAPGPCPAVVICHGFKGFMEWGFFPSLAELLSARGFVTVRFNFSGSGMEPGEDSATDLDGFRENTFSKDLRDLLAVLEALPSVTEGRADTARVGLLGHSRGGGTVLLASTQDAWRGRVKALVTWASVSTYHRFTAEHQEIWRQGGEILVANARTGQQLPMGPACFEDLEANADDLDLAAAARKRQAPWLILHGEADETVALAEAKSLRGAAVEPATLEIVPKASHTFDCRHPFAGPTPALITTLNSTQAFFRRYL